MQVEILKNDLTALADALHWVETRIDNQSTIVHGLRGTGFFHVHWKNAYPLVVLEGEDFTELIREAEEWLEAQHWKIAELRAKARTRKIEKRWAKTQPIERCLRVLHAAVRPKPRGLWDRLRIRLFGR